MLCSSLSLYIYIDIYYILYYKMLLFQDLIFVLCVSVLVSIFMASVSLFYHGKNTAADVAEKRIKHGKVEINNGFSKDGSFSGFECVDSLFDESSVDDVAVVETGPDNVGYVENVRVLGGVGFVKEVFDEGNLGSEFGEIVDRDNVELVEEGLNGSFELDNGVLGEKIRGISIGSLINKSCVDDLVDKVSKSSFSLECVLGGVEFKEHIVDEILDKTKDGKLVMKYEVYFDNVEDLKETKATESEISEEIVSSGVEFEENSERVKYSEFVIESEEKEETLIFDEGYGPYGDKEEWIDDWEGIESTGLEKRFGDAVVFVGSKGNSRVISCIDSVVKMQLYGLHKAAIEGPCYVQQPMALKVSARAKWNAWHLLGEISREVAMEKYIALLSKILPEWSEENPNE